MSFYLCNLAFIDAAFLLRLFLPFLRQVSPRGASVTTAAAAADAAANSSSDIAAIAKETVVDTTAICNLPVAGVASIRSNGGHFFLSESVRFQAVHKEELPRLSERVWVQKRIGTTVTSLS